MAATSSAVTEAAWFTNSELPGGLSSIGDLGTEDMTFWSEQEDKTDVFNIGNRWDDHTPDRQEFMLSTHTAAYRLKGGTGDIDMKLIHDDMAKYKEEGLLLIWLQAFHLWSISPEFKDWKEKDPIHYCEKELLDLSNSDIEDYHNKTQVIVDGAFEFANNSPFPSPDEAFKHLFAD